MSFIAITLILVSSFLHVLRDFYTKKAEDKQIFIWWFVFFSLLFTLPFAVYFLLKTDVNPFGILLAALFGLIHFCYWVYYSKAYEDGDLSHVYPIIRSTPFFVFLIAIIFLQEKISLQGILGIILVCIGAYGINLKQWNIKVFFQPLIGLRKERYLQYALVALLCTTFISITDKTGVNYLHPIIYSFIIAASANVFFSIYILKTKPIATIRQTWKSNKSNILFNGLLAATNYPLVLFAYTLSNVSYVTALRQISVVIAVIMGGHFLKEKYKKIRLISASIICAGSILIILS